VIEWGTSKEGTVYQLQLLLDYTLNLMMLSGLMILIHRDMLSEEKFFNFKEIQFI
jgi:hypothetical protein